MQEIDNLNKFGLSYQLKIITCLLTDKNFFLQIYDILLEDFFESESNKWLISKLKNHFTIYKELPTLDIIKVFIQEEKNEVLKVDIIDKLKQIYQFRNDKDLNFIKDNFIKFCKNQKIKSAIYESLDDLKNENYDKIKLRFDEAYRAGIDKNIGLNLFQSSVDDVFTTLKRNTVKTPWEVITNLLDGGLAPGELGLLVAGPGAGKSWVLSALGLYATAMGKSVLHYTLELSEVSIAKRYYSILTGIAAHALPFNIEDIKVKLNNVINKKGRLIIKNYPTKSASINTIKSHTEKSILMHEADENNLFVIIDYGDLLKSKMYYREKRLEIGNIFEDIRGYAGEFITPVWSATQSNRSGADGNIIVGEQVSEDYSKIMISDFIMSLHRKIEDKLSKTARVHIIKNRFGPDALTYPAKLNTDTGHMQIFEEASNEGNKLKNDMKTSEVLIKKMLKDKYYNNKK